MLLKHHLKQLRLPTMHADCEKIAARAASDYVDHLGFLLQLTELEPIERKRKSAERRLKAARYPSHKTLDEFDFQARPSVNKPLVLQFIPGDYLEQRENNLLVGPSGTGKSHLATSLGIAACGQGKQVRFFRVTELITLLLEAKSGTSRSTGEAPMSSLAVALKDEIRRLARKEIKQQTGPTAQAVTRCRREIAQLKRQTRKLETKIGFLENQVRKRLGTRDAGREMGDGARFSARSVKAQRQRAGLSAADKRRRSLDC